LVPASDSIALDRAVPGLKTVASRPERPSENAGYQPFARSHEAQSRAGAHQTFDARLSVISVVQEHLMNLHCRFCGTPIHHVMADLGMQPMSNAIREPWERDGAERFYPLRAMVCESCLLVQAPNYESAEEIFSADYPYFSSISAAWLDHARHYTETVSKRFSLGPDSLVVEIASNDGYLLRWFKDVGIPVLGIEPTASTAEAAERLGIPVQRKFFGQKVGIELRDQGFAADLMPANNVVAHVPLINDFVAGFTALLKPTGVATFEFHHLLKLFELGQFDTIYHEHFYYHSLSTFSKILERNGLSVFDIEELPTHGGSLRVYAQRQDTCAHPMSARVADVLAREKSAGLTHLATYLGFNERIKATKRELLRWLIQAKNDGKKIVGYGAPAKGNTLLNYIGARTDFFEYVVDDTPQKQGRYLPGTTIPIKSPGQIAVDRPDYVVILAWNWADEIKKKPELANVVSWGGQVVTLMPAITLHTRAPSVNSSVHFNGLLAASEA
jgi:hypothetical protein